jgi:UDP-N-acetylmuramate dehydrogenase
MTWWKKLKGRVKLKQPLRNKTTFKIGGPAKFFIEPKDAADLKSLIISAKKYNIPILPIGRGSNILISDKGTEAVVLQLNSPPFKRVINNGNLLEVGSGLTLAQLIQSAKSYSLSGVEFLAGIPGAVGGALSMNAGAWGNNLGDIVENVTVMDYNGNIKILNKKNIRFGYRKSNLAKFIILSTRIRLIKKNKKEINSNIKKYLRFRRNAQDNRLPNAGCIFKNPSGRQAGRLIDLCGLKGRRQGGAFVSWRHANFILNRGDACAADVLKLMNLIKNRVKHKFNVNLKPEIKIWK